MKKTIIANWKMNPSTQTDALALARQYKKFEHGENSILVACPPTVFLQTLINETKGSLIWGAQDCFWEGSGPYTGENSPLMLKSVGAKYVLIGHSERREHLKESDVFINKKLKAALSAKLHAVLCVGGGDEARKKDADIKRLIKTQMGEALAGVPTKYAFEGKLLIAYEPSWAIGTGKPASAKHASEIGFYIRWLMDKQIGSVALENMPVIYGGSVTSGNAEELIKKSNLDGFLVGGASLNPNEFVKILQLI